MKLNKNGWSLTSEIVYMIIFAICLLIAIIGIIRMNLLVGHNNNENNSNFNYSYLEEKLEEAAKNYINDKEEIFDEEIIKSSILKSGGYLTDFKDGDNTDCKGYVEVKVEEDIIYKSFITCFDYTTKGYDYKKE